MDVGMLIGTKYYFSVGIFGKFQKAIVNLVIHVWREQTSSKDAYNVLLN